MYINDKDRQRDSLIGEAVLAILDEKSFITNTLLLTKLQHFSSVNAGSLKQEALDCAIKMIMASESQYDQTYKKQ